jgi:hypothetical protein
MTDGGMAMGVRATARSAFPAYVLEVQRVEPSTPELAARSK